MGRMRTLLALAALPLAVVPAVAISAADPQTVAVANPQAWPTARSPQAITDPATERRISRLLSRMSIEQKVGQLIQADISTIKPDDLARYPLGSILAGGNSGPFGNERASANDWHRMVEEYRAASLKPAANGIAIPILFGVDAVHGHSNLPGATIFPHNIGLGAARDPALIERIGRATAEEVAGSGIEWTFAPTLAVPQDLRWGRTLRRLFLGSEAGRRLCRGDGARSPGAASPRPPARAAAGRGNPQAFHRRWRHRPGSRPGRFYRRRGRADRRPRRGLSGRDRRRGADGHGQLLELARGQDPRQPQPSDRSV